MARPLFQLGSRLALCAELVQGGKALCDVGTDHAYLPIWLLKSGKVPRAAACDINPGPLETARANARRYGVEDRLVLRLSDGLEKIAPEEGEEVVIAGMGGELILRIIRETPWLQSPERNLVLQPMSSAEELRRGLRELGFELMREEAVIDGGRPYTAFSAVYRGALPEAGFLYPYLGALTPGSREARAYAQKLLRDLRGRLQGALRGRSAETPETLEKAILEIEKLYGLRP